MNTFNEFELNRIKRLYADELASRLQRSKSTRPTAGLHLGPSFRPGAGSRQEAAEVRRSAERLLQATSPLGPPRHLLRAQLRNDQDQDDDERAEVVNLRRYQQALASKRRSRARQQVAAGGGFGRVLYDFVAKEEAELSLRRGDLVELVELAAGRPGSGWARVEDCQSGLQGLVPLSYLDFRVGCAVAKRDVAMSSRPSSRAASAGRGDAGEEHLLEQLLPMSKGEPIALIRRLSGHLYEASNTRQALGLVWSNDLDIIEQPAPTEERPEGYASFGASCQQVVPNFDDLFGDDFTDDDDDDDGDPPPLPPHHHHRRHSRHDAEAASCGEPELEEAMLLLDSGQQVLERRRRARSASGADRQRRGQLAEATCCAEGRPEEGQYEHCCCHPALGQQQVPAGVPRRSSSSPLIGPLVERAEFGAGDRMLAGQPPAVQQQQQRQQQEPLPRLCRVRYAYKPRQKDELELVVGDTLVVVHECDDGWFIGSSCQTKQVGTFPGNFVEPV